MGHNPGINVRHEELFKKFKEIWFLDVQYVLKEFVKTMVLRRIFEDQKIHVFVKEVEENFKPTIDAFMENMPKDWRYRWCESKRCYCLGGANCSGGLRARGFTKEDWQKWVDKNPKE